MRVFTTTVGHGAELTCYVQDPSEELALKARPAVLVLPGGGYFFTSDREAEPVALAYLAEGFNAFVLRYSTGADAPFEQSFDDAKAALAWLRASADDLHIDGVAAVGFSAGGHLAASLATAATDKPDALVVGYPVTLAEFGPPIGKDILDIPSLVTGETPPTFLFSTCDDVLVPVRNSLEFLSALAAHHVPFESHIYLLGVHGLSLAKPLTASGRADHVDEAVAQWLPDSVRFLRAVFGGFTTSGEPETYETVLARRVVGMDMPINRLLDDEAGAAALRRHAPAVAEAAPLDLSVARSSIRQLLEQGSGLVTPEAVAGLEAELTGQGK